MKRPDRERFSTLLAAALKDAGVTQGQAADAIRMPPNSFRTKVARNTFTEAEGRAAMAVIRRPLPDGTTTDFGRRWSVGGTPVGDMPLAQAIRVVDRQRRALDERMDRLAARLPDLIRAMRDGDYAISSSSTVTPLEMERDAAEDLTTAVAAAVAGGGTFVYIRPDKNFLDRFVTAWRFTRVPGFDEVLREVAWFRERIQTALVKMHAYTPARAARRVRDRVVQVYTGDSPFWSAGFCSGVLHTAELDGTVLRRAVVRVPGPHRRALIQPADYDLFAARFASFAIRALRQARGRRGLEPPDAKAIDRVLTALEKGGAYE